MLAATAACVFPVMLRAIDGDGARSTRLQLERAGDGACEIALALVDRRLPARHRSTSSCCSGSTAARWPPRMAVTDTEAGGARLGSPHPEASTSPTAGVSDRARHPDHRGRLRRPPRLAARAPRHGNRAALDKRLEPLLASPAVTAALFDLARLVYVGRAGIHVFIGAEGARGPWRRGGGRAFSQRCTGSSTSCESAPVHGRLRHRRRAGFDSMRRRPPTGSASSLTGSAAAEALASALGGAAPCTLTRLHRHAGGSLAPPRNTRGDEIARRRRAPQWTYGLEPGPWRSPW